MASSSTGAINALTMIAAADLRTKQFCAVRQSGADLVNVASDPANKAGLGILLNKPDSGRAATIQIEGECRGIAGASITAGALVATTSGGHLVTATSGQFVFGRAINGAADNDYFRVLLAPFHGGDL